MLRNVDGWVEGTIFVSMFFDNPVEFESDTAAVAGSDSRFVRTSGKIAPRRFGPSRTV
jgi:hypothetical protein